MRNKVMKLAALIFTVATAASMPHATLAQGALMPADAASVGMSAQRLAVLDAGIQAEIDKGTVAGVVVAVARHGKLVHNKAYGLADIASGEAMRSDHLFRLYSMTKAVASVALLTLYEQGHFQLNDPLEMYIPAFANLKVYAGQDANGGMLLEDMKRKPTVLDAFRHTLGLAGGVGQHPIDLVYREHGLAMGDLESLSDEMQKLGEVPLRYQPGEQWVYGLGHDVQAYLVEYFSGMPYADYLQSVIFDPLGMQDTMFGVPPARAERFATVYGVNADGGLQAQQGDAYARYTDHAFATLSLSGSTGDYLRFAQMLLNKGELDGVRILGRKTVEMMSRNWLPENIASISANGPHASGWGLGVSVIIDEQAYGHMGSQGAWGWSGAASTFFSVDPQEDMTYVIMAQKMPTDAALRNKIENLIYQALVE
ncbi:MAG: Esterase EstB [Pseudomonadota bacterium]|jgi:CubicO group peptidase (beta-lactamase class C family)